MGGSLRGSVAESSVCDDRGCRWNQSVFADSVSMSCLGALMEELVRLDMDWWVQYQTRGG